MAAILAHFSQVFSPSGVASTVALLYGLLASMTVLSSEREGGGVWFRGSLTGVLSKVSEAGRVVHACGAGTHREDEAEGAPQIKARSELKASLSHLVRPKSKESLLMRKHWGN